MGRDHRGRPGVCTFRLVDQRAAWARGGRRRAGIRLGGRRARRTPRDPARGHRRMSTSAGHSANGGPAGPLLKVSGLTIGFPLHSGHALAADRVEFEVNAGETLGIVGESGSGKSVSLRALLGVVPAPGKVLAGTATWRGTSDLLAMSQRELRDVRGKQIAMVFQDPSESLNPVYTIGHQLEEVLTKRGGLNRRDAQRRAVELLARVGIPSPD